MLVLGRVSETGSPQLKKALGGETSSFVVDFHLDPWGNMPSLTCAYVLNGLVQPAPKYGNFEDGMLRLLEGSGRHNGLVQPRISLI